MNKLPLGIVRSSMLECRCFCHNGQNSNDMSLYALDTGVTEGRCGKCYREINPTWYITENSIVKEELEQVAIQIKRGVLRGSIVDENGYELNWELKHFKK